MVPESLQELGLDPKLKLTDEEVAELTTKSYSELSPGLKAKLLPLTASGFSLLGQAAAYSIRDFMMSTTPESIAALRNEISKSSMDSMTGLLFSSPEVHPYPEANRLDLY